MGKEFSPETRSLPRVARRNHNPCVVGSNPSSATKDIND
jgi:hypothetical protein